MRITLERLLKDVEKDESLAPKEDGSLYLEYAPTASGPYAGLMMHMVHGDPCTEWFDDKAASFRRLPALETEIRQALKVLPRSANKSGPKPRKSELHGHPHPHGVSPGAAPRLARLEYVPPQVHKRGMSKIVLRRYP